MAESPVSTLSPKSPGPPQPRFLQGYALRQSVQHGDMPQLRDALQDVLSSPSEQVQTGPSAVGQTIFCTPTFHWQMDPVVSSPRDLNLSQITPQLAPLASCRLCKCPWRVSSRPWPGFYFSIALSTLVSSFFQSCHLIFDVPKKLFGEIIFACYLVSLSLFLAAPLICFKCVQSISAFICDTGLVSLQSQRMYRDIARLFQCILKLARKVDRKGSSIGCVL